jgi:hypothetical protein
VGAQHLRHLLGGNGGLHTFAAVYGRLHALADRVEFLVHEPPRIAERRCDQPFLPPAMLKLL